jgi:hypothetical protein
VATITYTQEVIWSSLKAIAKIHSAACLFVPAEDEVAT